MMAEGVDYAFQHPTVAGLVAAGKKFACRYVGPGTDGKHLHLDEAQALSAAGIAIVANAEGTANGLLNGKPTGRDWALSAHNMAVACGMPPDKPIYLSVDFDCTERQWSTVREALDGAAEVLGASRVGVYGGYDVIAWAARDRVAAWFWQTYAWSEGRWHPRAHIRQYRNGVKVAGGTVDLNLSMVEDIGQWRIGDETEDDMADVYYEIASTDAAWNGKVFVSNRIHRRGPIRGAGGVRNNAIAGATRVLLTDADRKTEGWESFLDSVAGPPFPALPAAGLAQHTHTLAAGETGPVGG